jgi:hypothetical protein
VAKRVEPTNRAIRVVRVLLLLLPHTYGQCRYRHNPSKPGNHVELKDDQSPAPLISSKSLQKKTNRVSSSKATTDRAPTAKHIGTFPVTTTSYCEHETLNAAASACGMCNVISRTSPLSSRRYLTRIHFRQPRDQLSALVTQRNLTPWPRDT